MCSLDSNKSARRVYSACSFGGQGVGPESLVNNSTVAGGGSPTADGWHWVQDAPEDDTASTWRYSSSAYMEGEEEKRPRQETEKAERWRAERWREHVEDIVLAHRRSR